MEFPAHRAILAGVKIWGITGLMGSGKSTALALLRARKFHVLDADQVAREVVDPSTPEGALLAGSVAAHFGKDVQATGGGLDRARLRTLLAHRPGAREDLERLLHPAILQQITLATETWAEEGARLGFIEGSRLVESGYAARLTGLILVTATEDLRVERVMRRDKSAIEDVRAILRLQDESAMRQAADEIWVNSGFHEDLERQIDEFLQDEAKS